MSHSIHAAPVSPAVCVEPLAVSGLRTGSGAYWIPGGRIDSIPHPTGSPMPKGHIASGISLAAGSSRESGPEGAGSNRCRPIRLSHTRRRPAMIVVVDDEPDVLAIICSLLEDEGHPVL